MKVDTIQTSFVTGEIAPALFGRTDIAQYESACEEVENFLIRPYGPLLSTPGTEFIAECKTGGSTGIVRILEFNFSRTDAYIIEMGVGLNYRYFIIITQKSKPRFVKVMKEGVNPGFITVDVNSFEVVESYRSYVVSE